MTIHDLKTLGKLKVKESFVNLINDIYEKPTATSILNGGNIGVSQVRNKVTADGKDVYSHYCHSTLCWKSWLLQ